MNTVDRPADRPADTAMSGPTLALRDVSKSFGSVAAVSAVSLDVADDEILALVGPSGCGKSTLLRLVAGLYGIDAGSVRIADVVVDDGGRRIDPEDRHVGLVFQEHALFPHLTVAANVTFGMRSVPRSARSARMEEWLQMVGLGGFAERYPHELSGFERQRVALARALAPEPRLMLLDEPFASLDPSLRAQVRHDVVEILRATGTPTVFVTHDQAEALAIGDRVAVMRAGRLEQVDTPEVVFHQPCNRFVARFMVDAAFLALDGSGAAELGASWAIAAGGGESVLIRPDDVALARVGADDDGPVATVIAAEFRGPTWCYTLALASGEIVQSTQPHTERYDVGAEVRASLVPGHDPFVITD
ncbi:ABC transporter ATP-binding protein [soil metagenome]